MKRLVLLMVWIASNHSLAATVLPTITVHSHVSVAGPKVFVGDLLTAESKQFLKTRALDGALVTLAPPPGKAKTLDIRIVHDKLVELGITPDRYNVATPALIRVERQAQTLSPAEIEDFVRHEFLPDLPWEDVRLVELGVPEPVALPVGIVELSIQPPAKTDLARPFYLSVDFRVDGQTAKRAYFRTVLEILETVPVAARELTPLNDVTASDIRWEKRILRSTLRTPVESESFLEGRRPRTRIAAGELLTQEMFRAVPLIRRGDRVTLLFDDGRIRITTSGESLASGSRGDRIRVMNAESRVELVGEIIDGKTVRIGN